LLARSEMFAVGRRRSASRLILLRAAERPRRRRVRFDADGLAELAVVDGEDDAVGAGRNHSPAAKAKAAEAAARLIGVGLAFLAARLAAFAASLAAAAHAEAALLALAAAVGAGGQIPLHAMQTRFRAGAERPQRLAFDVHDLEADVLGRLGDCVVERGPCLRIGADETAVGVALWGVGCPRHRRGRVLTRRVWP